MKLRLFGCCCAAVLAVLAGTVASAQTLADVARAEESRRKTVKEPSKVYTNNDLKRDASGSETPAPASTAKPAPTGDAAPPPAGAEAKAQDAAGQKDAPANAPARDRAYWSDRMKQAQDQLDRSKMFLAALETRVNALNTDFVNRDDPAQRAIVERDRQRATAEMDRVRKDITQQTKAIADIEDEARRAGVPAGWLR
jgi:hypothetical protein